MGKEQTIKSKYPSRYSKNKYVTSAQYIVELICEQSAKHSKKDLPLQFWKDPEWSKFFRSQTGKVNKLLKKYDDKAIINAVKNKRLRSLLAMWVEGVIQDEQKILDSKKIQKLNSLLEERQTNKDINKEIPTSRKVSFGMSKIDKLLALDGDI